MYPRSHTCEMPWRFTFIRAGDEFPDLYVWSYSTMSNYSIITFVSYVRVCSGDTRDLVPPAPSLTRYKKEVAMKSVSNKKKTADPRLPDERRSSEINLLSTTSLCVRLNTLHVSCFVLVLVDDFSKSGSHGDMNTRYYLS